MLTITRPSCWSNDKDIRVLRKVLTFVCSDVLASILPKVCIAQGLFSIWPISTIVNIIIFIIIVITLLTLIIEVRFTIKGRIATVRLIIINLIVVILHAPRQISGANCSQAPDGLNTGPILLLALLGWPIQIYHWYEPGLVAAKAVEKLEKRI